MRGRGGLTALARKSRWAWVKGLEGLEVGSGAGEVAALEGGGGEGGEVAVAAVARSRGDVWRERVRMDWENRGVRKSYMGRLHRTSRAAGLVVSGAIVAVLKEV